MEKKDKFRITATIFGNDNEKTEKMNGTLKTLYEVKNISLEQFCKQGIEGLLYDLNRDEATTLTLNNERAINDLAVAQVIRYLHAKVYGE